MIWPSGCRTVSSSIWGVADRQVKIRGHRIELEEIESVLETHPEIRAVTVEVREDLPGDKRLVAFVVTAPGSALNVNHLRAFLKEQLPDPMIPSCVRGIGCPAAHT